MSDIPLSAAPSAAQHWKRHSPLQSALRTGITVVIVAAVVWSLRTIEIIPEFLYDAPAQTMDLFARMWPLDWAFFPTDIFPALIETINIAALGTVLAIVMALPLSFLAARNVTRSPVARWIAQFLFVSSRSVNSLIWALLFVAIFGPGALAGVLSIAFRSIGFVGRLFGEAVEDAHPGPVEALTAAGAGTMSVLVKGYWPQVQPAFWSIVLLRWDINVRESAVLGLVGAGGIGVALDAAISNLYWDQAGLVLLTIFGVVWISEFVTSRVRARII
ncbi:phosphonate ABC transporter, permease protein PhnE [Tropicimonas sp. IMCC34043]|uniref:phosphonate ABC transporter, permease protein PhnE n=1 Tax=Tropicimonas sp. IMCC34043 TaxID=2248760 RepID=UPI000E21E93F|nr:phosphonate ABC transporter, permease protein PhnE [Tropicimonas sp. IMCC34043]